MGPGSGRRSIAYNRGAAGAHSRRCRWLYAPAGHLLFMKMGTLMAVPFDVRTLQVTGDPAALIQGVMQAVNAPNSDDETGAEQFTLSNSGTLVYVTGGTHPNKESSLVLM